MNVIKYYKSYIEAVCWQCIKAIRSLQYGYYLRKFEALYSAFIDTEYRCATKQDYDHFRDKYGFSETIMGLFAYILVYERGCISHCRETYRQWYSEDDVLALLLSGSSAWEKLQKLQKQMSDDNSDKQLLVQLKHILLIEMIEHKMYLRIPLK